jgi:peptidoglycan/xylan/chitin deacetylase (PgdA/CDA1 family)
MNARRAVLYSVYGVLKSMGYFRLRDGVAPYATVLTFHRVNDKDQNPLTVHPSMFEELLDVLSCNYRIVPLAGLLEMIAAKKGVKSRTVAITFDDGYLDNFSIAAPILKRRSIPATFFVTSGYIGTERRFPWDAKSLVPHPMMAWHHVRQLAADGFEIGAHSINHVNLGTCSDGVLKAEIVDCKRQIEDHLGKAITGFAYPFGGPQCMNEFSSRIIQETGFAYSCSNYGGKVTGLSDCYNIERTGVYSTTTEMLMEIDNFMTYLDGSMRLHFLGAAFTVGSCSKPGEDS